MFFLITVKRTNMSMQNGVIFIYMYVCVYVYKVIYMHNMNTHTIIINLFRFFLYSKITMSNLFIK